MRASVLGALLALAPVAASAQIPDITATPHELRTKTPAQLGTLLFGAESPTFTDSWVEGPTREWRAIRVDLATTPEETGFAGLCRLTVASTYFLTVKPGAEDSPLEVGTSQHASEAYVLTSDRPELTRSDTQGSCKIRKPLSSYPIPPTILRVLDASDAANPQAATSAAARFGLVALRAAQAFAQKHAITAERCPAGFADIPASCGDPAAFVRSFYFRQVESLLLVRCEKSESICVDAAVAGLDGSGMDHVVIDTGEAAVRDDARLVITPKSVILRSGGNPIID